MSRADFEAVLAAARQTSPQDYLSQHMRAWARVDPDAVARVLRDSSLSAEDRASVARELGVSL